jgi:hypothetical protein
MLVGGVVESNYSPYQGADFVRTTCTIIAASVIDTSRQGYSAFYVDIWVNYTIEGVADNSIIQFGGNNDITISYCKN